MRLAFVIYKYFPFGGLQRDMRRFVEEIQRRGHHCRIYTRSWQGELIEGVELRRVPAFGIGSHRRNKRFLRWVQRDLANDPVDGVVGFNKMPGLDVYFAGDPCYLDWALQQQGWFSLHSGRFTHFAEWERAVFAPDIATLLLLLSTSEQQKFVSHYHTPPERMVLLPPGVALHVRAPEDAAAQRKSMRRELGLEEMELTLLLVGSSFVAKGLDRAIASLATMRTEQPSVSARLLVVGQDKSRRFARLARRFGVEDRVSFLGGRHDVAQLMLAADLLIHPARAEGAGVVLLEALAAGLPVVTTENCGYAHHVKAARAGIVLAEPFSQEQLDRAVMRNIDGVFRSDCRQSALLYSSRTDLYSMHSTGADLILDWVGQKTGQADV